ncbi:FMN-binding negative transcriptional regulator [Variovorax sp. PCZ-1]|uniref:FMN-binding negative transcriptional regulator n=1 Tax=Variovorax sp. PCZ-1 TaxID=2835533 RepID=UPI001BCCCD7E|nr:FMN-binding negative transcriptional regulator [Variovorax sp. PCZ-1]MBS7808396.1 FMN-binding negative transcriptional regulator [Variovorax sp. PCZ-1]
MHIQPIFAVADKDELHQLMRAYPLATVIITVAGRTEVNLLPVEISSDGELGKLSGHASRNHALFQLMSDGSEATVLFQSPNAYISPRWYVSGQQSGRNAPSWNYIAVQARGQIRWVDDREWLMAHLAALTAGQEAGRVNEWRMQDAAPDHIENAANHLLGFEIHITELLGKKFLSQQRTPIDRESLVMHLKTEFRGAANDVADLIDSMRG